MQKHILLFLLIFIISEGKAQEKYWVFFNSKDTTEVFDPYEYFDQKAIQRRINHSLPLYDFYDLPVNPEFLSAVQQIADSTGRDSRWLNAVIVWGNAQQLQQILELPFVSGFRKIETSGVLASVPTKNIEEETTEIPDENELRFFQLNRMQANEFISNGFDGSGIRIAVLDAGFTNVDNHPAFRHLMANNKIIATYDFIRNRSFVFGKHTHGTSVLSNITGIYEGFPLGMATGAEFLLARTERGLFEYYGEEENWLAAMEWADRLGANIINSSLGYTYHRYFRGDMDGQTAMISRAANIAASKGILVINAAGNEATKEWNFIGAPADADSVLSVGGINPYTDTKIDFSSFGPTSDGRMKPNVCALGEVVAANRRSISTTYGTSFAAPLVAGFAACAWQTDTTLTNMELFRLIEQSAHLYPYFDYAHGFGIPQASFFINRNRNVEVIVSDSLPNPTFVITEDDYGFTAVVDDRFLEQPDEDDEEPILFHYIEGIKNLYYHIEDDQGNLIKYAVVVPNRKNAFSWEKSDLRPGYTLRIHFEGHTQSISIKKTDNIR